MLRRSIVSLAVLGGAAFALLGLGSVGWLVAVAYGAADVEQAAELAGWLRTRVEFLTGGTLAVVAARIGVPATVAAAREWFARTIESEITKRLGN